MHVQHFLKSKKNIVIITSVLLILLITYLKFTNTQHGSTTEPGANIYNVALDIIEVTPIETATFYKTSGNVESRHDNKILPMISGRISAVLLNEGMHVKAEDVIAEIEMNNAKERIEKAEALVKQREIEYASTKSLLEIGHETQAELEKAFHNLKEAESFLLQEQDMVDNSKIKANLDGLINSIEVHKGELVQSFQTIIATIIPNSDIIVTTKIPKKILEKISIDDLVPITIEDEEIVGKIRHVDMIAQNQTYTVQIKINPEVLMPLGSSVDINIPLKKKLLYKIPKTALEISDDGNIGLKIINKDEIVEFMHIKIESEDNSSFFVSAPIKDKISLINNGHNFFKEGISIKKNSHL